MGGMVPEDVYRLTGAADPRLSPDGKTVAFVVWSMGKDDNEYLSDIWLTASDGSFAARKFTSAGKRNALPRWSPDGTRLAFTSNRESEKMQLYVIPTSGGEARKLTDFDEDVSHVSWSPDGSTIAGVVRVQGEAYEEDDDKKRAPRRITRLQFKLDSVGWTFDRHAHIFTVPADGSTEATQVTKGDYEHGPPSWSPDGAQLAFASARHEDWDIVPASDVYVMGSSGGDPQCLTNTDGGCGEPVWSADGTKIAYHYSPGIWDDPHHGQIAVMDVGSRSSEILTASLDRQCAPYPLMRPPLWDGDDILFALEEHGNTHIYRVAANGDSKPESVIDGEVGVTGFDAAAGRLVYTASTPAELAELHNEDHKLTDVGKQFISERSIVAPERFTATSKDGSEVEAWIVRPAGFEEGKRYPALVNIHGGPFTQYATRVFDEFQVYSGAGYAVIFSNPRGSSGYSEEWGRAIRGPVDGGPGWGSVDYEDLMAVTEEAARRFDFIDSDRLGVMGGSYGGYMTSWIVGHTDRFKAACSERAVNNWVSMYGSSDFGWVFKSYMGSFLFEDMDTWIKYSPSTYATDINTPLLIIHSENDFRCDIEQAEQLFTTLRLLKRDVEFVRFPAESHELSRSGNPLHRVQRFEILIEFFDRYLKNA